MPRRFQVNFLFWLFGAKQAFKTFDNRISIMTHPSFIIFITFLIYFYLARQRCRPKPQGTASKRHILVLVLCSGHCYHKLSYSLNAKFFY